MANNHTLYSAVITKVKKKEREWWEKEVCSPDDAEDYEERLAEIVKVYGIDVTDAEVFPEFSWKYDESAKSIWIYAEEGGNLEIIAAVMQDFLAKFRPAQVWGMEFAFTCSSPRIGEFGGGAMVVTAKKTYWLNTGTWMSEKMRKLQGK